MKEAMLYQKIDEKKVHCFLCAHQCHINNGKYGFCRVRQNIDGTLFSHSYGKLIAQHVDPIEKKPLYHFFPGSSSFSIATKGCNFTCGFCQNWQISQTAKPQTELTNEISASYVVQKALELGCQSISCTYTEPTIFFEYAYDICKIAKSKNLSTVFVTNGYMTEQALNTIRPYLDACNIDLKSFNENFYRKNCSANLSSVLQTIKNVFESGIWVEITTLVIPQQNDSDDELKSIADFIADLSPDIPWHVSRFFPQYEFGQIQATEIETVQRAQRIGFKAGLRYVYTGNTAGETDTFCYNCKKKLIGRKGYKVNQMSVTENRCPECGVLINGRWK